MIESKSSMRQDLNAVLFRESPVEKHNSILASVMYLLLYGEKEVLFLLLYIKRKEKLNVNINHFQQNINIFTAAKKRERINYR